MKKLNLKLITAVLAAIAVLGACKKKNEGCTYTPGTTVATAAQEKVVTDYLTANSITAVELDNSGLYYVIDAAGTGAKPGLCNTVVAKYKGQLSNGTIFDQTAGTSTASFTLGGTIEGWKRGVPLIGAGGKIRLYIPSSMGYGEAGIFNSNTGLYTIPQNAMLIFDVEITAIL
ncbi:MAG: FKBP-type peptidyl-prolyl cis-trans isomerase [Lacibacter sp.]